MVWSEVDKWGDDRLLMPMTLYSNLKHNLITLYENNPKYQWVGIWLAD